MQNTPTPVTYPATCTPLLGAPVADALLAQLRALVKDAAPPPLLAIVLVGNNEASRVYVDRKKFAARKAGMDVEVLLLPEGIAEEDALAQVQRLGADPRVHGMIVQLPLPPTWDRQRMLDAVPPAKDVDGLGTRQQEMLVTQSPRALVPATPLGIMRLLQAHGVALSGTRAVVVGQSNLVGKPLAHLLRQAGALVETFGRGEPDPAGKVLKADLVCVATGVAGLVKPAWVKPGAVVVDVGITRLTDGNSAVLVGDVEQRVASVARAMTPVPGGVGPLTVASLLTNVADAWCDQRGVARVAWETPVTS